MLVVFSIHMNKKIIKNGPIFYLPQSSVNGLFIRGAKRKSERAVAVILGDHRRESERRQRPAKQEQKQLDVQLAHSIFLMWGIQN